MDYDEFQTPGQQVLLNQVLILIVLLLDVILISVGGSYVTETSWSISTSYNGESLAASEGGDNSCYNSFFRTDEDCSALIGCMDMHLKTILKWQLLMMVLVSIQHLKIVMKPLLWNSEVQMVTLALKNGIQYRLDTAQFVTASVEGSYSTSSEVSIYASCGDTALAFGVLEAGTYYVVSITNLSLLLMVFHLF